MPLTMGKFCDARRLPCVRVKGVACHFVLLPDGAAELAANWNTEKPDGKTRVDTWVKRFCFSTVYFNHHLFDLTKAKCNSKSNIQHIILVAKITF